MPKRVQLPDGNIGEFPDTMSDQAIAAVLQKQFPPDTISSPPTGIKGVKAGIATQAGKLGDVASEVGSRVFRKENLPAAVATAYGIAGAPLGPAGVVGMATLGGGTGRAIEQMIETKQGHRQPSSGAAAMDIGWEGAKQGAYEGVGLVVAGLASRILPISRGARLSYAGGLAQGERAVQELAPEFDKTIAAAGSKAPQTVGEFADVIQGTNTRLEQEFDQALFPVAQARVRPLTVANEIRQKITPNMAKTPEGRQTIKILQNKARQFETQDWTIGELNQERMTVAKRLRTYFNSGPSVGAAKAKLDADIMADTAQRDALNDILYSTADKSAGKPAGYFKALKQKQSTLIDLTDDITAHQQKLLETSAQKRGAPMSEKAHVYGYAHPTSGHFGSAGTTVTPSRFLDPAKQADKMVRRAFPGTAGKVTNAARTAVGKTFSSADVNALPIRVLFADEPEMDTTPPEKKSPGQQKRDLNAIVNHTNPNLPVGP